MAAEVVLSEGFEVALGFNGGLIEMNNKESCNSMLGLHGDENDHGVFDVDRHMPMNHCFYFVRHRPYDDPKLNEKLDAADKEIRRSNQSRIQIIDELKANRAKRDNLFARLNFLKWKRNWTATFFDQKKNQSEHFHPAHGHTAVDGRCGKDSWPLENQYQIEQEKQFLKEVKQVEGTAWEGVAATVAKTRDFCGRKEFIQDQIMGVDMIEVKDLQTLTASINRLRKQLDEKIIKIESLESELELVTDKREKAYENIQALRRKRDEENATFYLSRGLLAKARELAAKRTIKDLEDLSHSEVEKFMCHWNCNKKFRVDYVKRISASLDARQLSRDARIRNPGEEPGDEKENYPECNDALIKKEVKEPAKRLVDSSQASSDRSDIAELDIPCCEKPSKEEVIDEARLKEMKREEEAEKARRAMERKRKLQEKAAMKAAIRAQKEAEKKLKEREKKAKKKAAANSCTLDTEKPLEEVTETFKLEMVKRKFRSLVKETTKRIIPWQRSFRFRNRKNETEYLRKAIIRRRKWVIYWDLAIYGAAVALVLFLVGLFFHAFWLAIGKRT